MKEPMLFLEEIYTNFYLFSSLVRNKPSKGTR